MGKTKTTIIAFLIVAPNLIIPVSRSQTAKRIQENRPPSVISFTADTIVLDVCPFSSRDHIVKFNVNASDPDNDPLIYRYQVSGGRIIGKGPQVGWDLRTALGKQRIQVEGSDRRGGKAFSEVVINVRPSGACDPACATIRVVCPDQLTTGQLAGFTAYVSGPHSGRKLRYRWSVTNGRVVAGRLENKLRIRVTGLAGEVVTATVNVRGLEPACSNQESCASKIEN